MAHDAAPCRRTAGLPGVVTERSRQNDPWSAEPVWSTTDLSEALHRREALEARASLRRSASCRLQVPSGTWFMRRLLPGGHACTPRPAGGQRRPPGCAAPDFGGRHRLSAGPACRRQTARPRSDLAVYAPRSAWTARTPAQGRAASTIAGTNAHVVTGVAPAAMAWDQVDMAIEQMAGAGGAEAMQPAACGGHPHEPNRSPPHERPASPDQGRGR